MSATIENILLELNRLDEQLSETHDDAIHKTLINRRNALSEQLKQANRLMNDSSKVLKG